MVLSDANSFLYALVEIQRVSFFSIKRMPCESNQAINACDERIPASNCFMDNGFPISAPKKMNFYIRQREKSLLSVDFQLS